LKYGKVPKSLDPGLHAFRQCGVVRLASDNIDNAAAEKEQSEHIFFIIFSI
jgi:hypothetical protein